jgi:hypothetical protein
MASAKYSKPNWLPFRFTFTARPRFTALEGHPVKKRMTVAGLNQLDAQMELNKQLHKQGLAVHFVLEVEQLPVPMPWRRAK